MLLLNRHEVTALLSMDAALAAVEEGFRRLAAGQAIMPQRAALEVAAHNGLHLSMPVYVAGGGPHAQADPGALSIKIVTVFGDNQARHGLPTIQGLLLLHDAQTGAPVALMDAEALTAIRTGAASGVATRYMARPDAQTLTLFGAGGQAAAQVEAICAVRPIRRVYVVTRSGRRDAEFCARLTAQLDIPVAPAQTLRLGAPRQAAVHAAVEAADIICTATNSPEPLFDGAWVRPGTHINAIGAYTRTLRELDAATVRRSRVIVDHHPAARAEAGDILLAIEEGAIAYEHVAGDLGAVVTGTCPGRLHADEVTLFKSVGLGVQDALCAAQVVAQARAQGVGTTWQA